MAGQKIIYRKRPSQLLNVEGEWCAYGLKHLFKAGDYITVHRKDGDTRREHVLTVVPDPADDLYQFGGLDPNFIGSVIPADVPSHGDKPEEVEKLPSAADVDEATEKLSSTTKGLIWNSINDLYETAESLEERVKAVESNGHQPKLFADVLDTLADNTERIVNLEKTQMENVLDAVEKTRNMLLKEGVIKQEIHVKVNGSPPVVLKGKTHAKFERVLRLAKARRNILLIGPAGCGKTYLAEQLAKAIKLDFSHVSCTAGMSEGQLTGRLIPKGKQGQFQYVRSELVRLYEEGGVFLFDEIDAADSNVMLVINSALSGNRLSVPNREEQPWAIKHKDFVGIAAANTYGTGADRVYVGRNQLDEATLDRFRIGQIEMDYDELLDELLCPNNELRTLLTGYRDKARAARLRRIISSRFMRDAQIMLDTGDSIQDIETALFCGWSEDEKAKVRS